MTGPEARSAALGAGGHYVQPDHSLCLEQAARGLERVVDVA